MKRNHWFILTIVLLIVSNVVWYFWSNWGLITVHAKNQPLGEVIRSIERQGHVTIKTNIDLAKPVQMDVDKVALAEALETLSVVTEGRWRLTYVIAPDKGAISAALGSITGGQRPEGWHTHYVPLRPVGPEPAVLPDPRSDSWVVKPATEATLQSYLEQASRNVSASFLVPESWNPAVTSPPGAGAIGKVLPKLVSAAKGTYEEVFLLQGDRARSADDDNSERPPADEERRTVFRAAMEERVQNEINKLSPADRAAALQEREEQKKAFEGLADLPPEQRAAKIQEFMSDPKNQERFDNANLARDARRSPQQRMQRGQKYLQRVAQSRKAAAQP